MTEYRTRQVTRIHPLSIAPEADISENKMNMTLQILYSTSYKELRDLTQTIYWLLKICALENQKQEQKKNLINIGQIFGREYHHEQCHLQEEEELKKLHRSKTVMVSSVVFKKRSQ